MEERRHGVFLYTRRGGRVTPPAAAEAEKSRGRDATDHTTWSPLQVNGFFAPARNSVSGSRAPARSASAPHPAHPRPGPRSAACLRRRRPFSRPESGRRTVPGRFHNIRSWSVKFQHFCTPELLVMLFSYATATGSCKTAARPGMMRNSRCPGNHLLPAWEMFDTHVGLNARQTVRTPTETTCLGRKTPHTCMLHADRLPGRAAAP